MPVPAVAVNCSIATQACSISTKACILTLFLQSASAAAVGENTENLPAEIDTEVPEIHFAVSDMDHSQDATSMHLLNYPWEINLLDCIAFRKGDGDAGQAKVHQTKRCVYASER